jgi:hypothetical protein
MSLKVKTQEKRPVGRPTKMRGTGTHIDKEKRVREILKKLGKGQGRKEIEEYLRRTYGICDETIRTDFKRAFEMLKKNQDNFITYIRELITERYELV